MTQREQVIVTGAGSGIGREFTRLFLADGAQVLAVSLLQDELAGLAAELDPRGERLSTLQLDLSVPDAAEQLVEYCRQKGLTIDVLVNNAGFACYGDAVDLDLDRVCSMLYLNIVTLTKLSTLFGRQMKARGRGRILNVGSTAGMVPSQRFASYSGSKAYVNAFSFSLRYELAPYGVSVTCLTPGPVGTKFAQTAEIDRFQGKSMLREMFAKGKASTPQEVALAAYRGMRSGRAHVLVGKGASLAGILSRLLPQRVLPGLVKNA